MVAVGLTACVPPVGCSVYALPSEPLIVTCVAFVAVTVNVEEFPAVMEAGLAAIVTVAPVGWVTVTIAVAEAVPPGPVADAAYVVVVFGLTACVPPLGCRV